MNIPHVRLKGLTYSLSVTVLMFSAVLGLLCHHCYRRRNDSDDKTIPYDALNSQRAKVCHQRKLRTFVRGVQSQITGHPVHPLNLLTTLLKQYSCFSFPQSTSNFTQAV